MGAPLVEAEQDSSICIEELPEVVVGRERSWLTEQRLVPLEAAQHVAYPYDRPRALHRCSPLWPTIAVHRSAQPARAIGSGGSETVQGARRSRFSNQWCACGSSLKGGTSR